MSGDPSITHGERLPDELTALVRRAGVSLDAIGLLAVVAGPGSFTGLRVGIATMQGLAMARDLRIVSVSALDALAFAAAGPAPVAGTLIAPWMDAQRGEVFAMLCTSDLATILAAPTSESPEATLLALVGLTADRHVTFVGDGALRYRDIIAAHLHSRASIVDPTPLLAPVAARIAAAHPDRAVLPHAVMPIYIRRPDAEIARARGTAGSVIPPTRTECW